MSRLQATIDDRAAHVGHCKPRMIREVVGQSAAYDYSHDRYQAYYSAGIRQFVERQGGRFSTISLTRFPALQRRLRQVRSSYRLNRLLTKHSGVLRGVDGLAHLLGGAPTNGFHPLVGRYQFRFHDGAECKVCIDAADCGAVTSDELLAWCDIYFKTNYWSNRAYAAKVVPLYNGNPLVLPLQNSLRESRSIEPRCDLCFVVRVWGGDNDIDGIEHNLQLIEAVNRVKCRKFLLAYLVAGDIEDQRKRLTAQQISCTTEPMRLADLWKVSAESRLNVLRLGMHGCIPWRMTDILAMGACPVLDQRPNTVWRDPFIENEHFLNLEAALTPNQHIASDSAYADIPEKVASFLADDATIRSIRETNAIYFDERVCPAAIGRQICETVSLRC